jgi:ABC-type transporter Mla subunit MlaD
LDKIRHKSRSTEKKGGISLNSQLVFTLKDFGMLVLWALLVAILIFILLVLIRFYRSFKDIMKIVDDHRTNIDKVLEEAPGITKNVNQISDEVNTTLKAFHGTIQNVAETTETVTGTIKDNKDIVSNISSVFNTARIVKGSYDRIFKSEDTYGPDPE